MDLHQQKVLLNSIRNLNEEREFVYWEKRFETEMYKRGHAYAVQILEGIENNNPEALQLRDTFLETVGVNLAEYNVFDAARRGARAGGDVAKTVGLRGGVSKFFALDAPFKLAGAAAGAAHHLLGGGRPEDAAEKHIQTQRAGYHPDVEPHEGPWSSHPHAPTINVNVSPTMTNVGGNTNVTTGDVNVGNSVRASATTIRRIKNSNRRGFVAIPGKPKKETPEPSGEETPKPGGEPAPAKPPVREPAPAKPPVREPAPVKPSPEPAPVKPSVEREPGVAPLHDMGDLFKDQDSGNGDGESKWGGVWNTKFQRDSQNKQLPPGGGLPPAESRLALPPGRDQPQLPAAQSRLALPAGSSIQSGFGSMGHSPSDMLNTSGYTPSGDVGFGKTNRSKRLQKKKDQIIGTNLGSPVINTPQSGQEPRGYKAPSFNIGNMNF